MSESIKVISRYLWWILTAMVTTTVTAQTDPLNYNMANYHPQKGLTVMVENEILTVIWDGGS